MTQEEGDGQMTEQLSFKILMDRILAGDEDAMRKLMHEYGRIVRVVGRVRGRSMHVGFDSSDVYNSVWFKFFRRARLGLYDLSGPAELRRLLAAIARNSLKKHAKLEHCLKRDRRRVVRSTDTGSELVDPGPSPSRVAASRELLEEVRKRFSDEERWIHEQRAAGREWAEIAAELGRNPDAVRMQFSRAADRVADELGLDDLD